VLTAAKQASKRFSKDVNEVECYIYECNWCTKNNATEYKDDYNVFAVYCNGDTYKQATCLLCGEKNNIYSTSFKKKGQITFAEVEEKRKLLDGKKETEKKRKAVDAKAKEEPSTKKKKRI
jgi:hypothetical protein